ncbi:unnamed protein product [Discula destructiva]
MTVVTDRIFLACDSNVPMATDEYFDAASSTSGIPYQALDASRQEVRFLRARRRDADGHIVVNLRNFSLREKECPRFIALSYVWGEHKLHSETITVDGQSCSVIESIHPMLSLLCDHRILRNETWFWIDYLCINQSDSTERATQVALMGRLYRLAFRTIVWLGELSPEVEGAMDTLYQIAAWPRKPTVDARDLLRDSVTPAQWDALSHWMDRPWWTRVWTLQEFLIPNRLVFHCGGESITKAKWASAIAAMYDYRVSGRPQRKAFGNQWARRRLLEYYDDDRLRDKMGLVALMAYVGYYKSTDDRDRIYAMLGICTDMDRHIVGPPDYSRSVDETYFGLARQFVMSHRSLDIICFSALFNSPSAAAAEGGQTLPSWVPDWRRWADQASRPVPSMVSEPSRDFIGNFRPYTYPNQDQIAYRASGNAVAEFSFSQDGRSLTCQGLVLDLVDGLGPVRHPATDVDAEPALHLVQSKSGTNTRVRRSTSALDQVLNRANSDDILESLVRSLCLDRASRYLTSEAHTGRYIHELQHALAAAPGAAAADGEGDISIPSEQRDVIEWVEANQGLRVQGATLQQHLDAASPPPDLPSVPGQKTVWRASETTVGELPWDCRLIVTDEGRLGMAPRAAGQGDLVVVLVGCSVPVVLRRVSGAGDAGCVVVGECFMPGIMSGEALHSGKGLGQIVLV